MTGASPIPYSGLSHFLAKLTGEEATSGTTANNYPASIAISNQDLLPLAGHFSKQGCGGLTNSRAFLFVFFFSAQSGIVGE